MDVDRMNGFSHTQGDPGAPGATKSPSPGDAEFAEGAEADRGMDVDGGASVRAGAGEGQDPERIGEPPAPLYTLTNGHSVGVQITPAKVADLKPTCTILAVAEANHVTQTLWRPWDPSILAASGEHFCGLWKVSGHDDRGHVQHTPCHTLIDRSDNARVTALAWEPGGSLLAVATYSESELAGLVRVYDAQHNIFLDTLPAAQKIVTSLRWQSVGAKLVGFACDVDSTLLLWDLSAPHAVAEPASVIVPGQVYDAHWAYHGNSSIICAAGDGVIYQCRAVSDLSLEQKWTSDPPGQDQWTFVRCSWWSDDTAIVIAAAAESSSLWVPSRNILMRRVHAAEITALELRPNQMIHPIQSSAYEFATSSMDNKIKVWRLGHNNDHLECLVKVHMGLDSPVLALSYSPDGLHFAGASYGDVKVWKADAGGAAVAQWNGQDTEWLGGSIKAQLSIANGDKMTGDDEQPEFADHSLSWDAEGRNLAFGLGGQVSVLFSNWLPIAGSG